MKECLMNHKKELASFIAGNRNAICEALGLNSNEIINNDIQIMVAYLTPTAGEKNISANGVDSRLLDELKELPADKVGHEILLKAVEASDRASSLGRKVSSALSERKLYSPKVEEALQARRHEMRTESFSKLSGNVVQLRNHLKSLAELLHGDGDFKDPAFRFQIRSSLKMISSDLNKCNYQARAGAVWAIKTGISPDSAFMAVQHVYLKHLNQLSKSFVAVDELINQHGIDCKMSKQIDGIQSRWYEDFKVVNGMKRETPYGNRYVTEPSC